VGWDRAYPLAALSLFLRASGETCISCNNILAASIQTFFLIAEPENKKARNLGSPGLLA
jgi:hypothetical protein